MKRISILLLVMVFLAGCVSFGARSNEGEVVTKIAARHMGYNLNKNYPDVAEKIFKLSNDILATKDSEVIRIAVDKIVSILTGEAIEDPLLRMDTQDLISLLGVRVDVEITEDQLTIIRSVARNLVEGIEL